MSGLLPGWDDPWVTPRHERVRGLTLVALEADARHDIGQPTLPRGALRLSDRHHQALRALANRLVAFMHGCLSTRRLHDEEAAWGGLKTEPAELAA